MSEMVPVPPQRAPKQPAIPMCIPVGGLQLQRALPADAQLLVDTIADNVEHIGRWEPWAITRRSMEERLQISPTAGGARKGYSHPGSAGSGDCLFSPTRY